MSISSINHSFNSPLFLDSNSICLLVEQLFLNPQHAKTLLASFSADKVKDKLLPEIWNHPYQTHKAKIQLIEAIAPHIPFNDAMNVLFCDDPLTALLLYAALSSPLKRATLDLFLQEENGYKILLEGWKLLSSSLWENRLYICEPLELLLDEMTPVERVQLFDLCCKQCSLCEQGQMGSLLLEKPFTKEFASAWGTAYDLEADIVGQLVELVKKIIADHPGPQDIPPLLTALFAFEGTFNDLDQTIFENLDQLEEKEQGITLCSLFPQRLENLIKTYDPLSDRKFLMKQLETLLHFTHSAEIKIQAVRIYLKNIDDEDILLGWMEEIQNRFSPIALYLWPALSDSAFGFLATEPDAVDLRSNLLRTASLSNPADIRQVVFYCQSLPRTEALFSFCTLDIVSQEATKIENESFGRWMTFSDFASIALEGLDNGDFSERLDLLRQDFQNLPPLLLALAFPSSRHKAWVTALTPFCSDEQLKALAGVFPDGVVDQLAGLLMADQFQLVLENLCPTVFKAFATRKAAECENAFTQLQQHHQKLHNRIAEIEVINGCPEQSLLDELQTEAMEQSARIRQLSGHSLKILTTVCAGHPLYAQKAFHRKLLHVQSSLVSHQTSLASQKSFFQRIEQLKPPLPPTPYFDFSQLSAWELKKTGASSWQEVGIFSSDDLQHLEMNNLEHYLLQPRLLVYWKILASKNLTKISTLIDACIIEPQQLYHLEKIARKLAPDHEIFRDQD